MKVDDDKEQGEGSLDQPTAETNERRWKRNRATDRERREQTIEEHGHRKADLRAGAPLGVSA
jgi:hypothetical protein